MFSFSGNKNSSTTCPRCGVDQGSHFYLIAHLARCKGRSVVTLIVPAIIAIFVAMALLMPSSVRAQEATPTPFGVNDPPVVATPTVGAPAVLYRVFMPIIGREGTDSIVGGCSENCNPTGGNPQGKAPVSVQWNSGKVAVNWRGNGSRNDDIVLVTYKPAQCTFYVIRSTVYVNVYGTVKLLRNGVFVQWMSTGRYTVAPVRRGERWSCGNGSY